ncbi:MAG: SgcJ/EcaC family oxidoreductase [Hyphomicrobiales bacterium]
MSEDEQAIHDLVSTWMEASRAGDTDKVLALMTDDMLFSVPGHEPFGKDVFAEMSRGMEGVEFEGISEIRECEVRGEWAWIRNSSASP